MAEDDYNEDIQYVSVMPARKKSRIMEEVTIQTSAPQKSGMKKKKQKKEREEMPFSDMERAGDRPRYEDIDFEERAKQEHLDSLYDDDYRRLQRRQKEQTAFDSGYRWSGAHCFSDLQDCDTVQPAGRRQQKVTETQDLNEKYEQIQLEKMQLQEELDALKNPDGAKTETTADGEKTESTTTDDKKETSSTTSSAGMKDYTVQQGDTPWTMAQKFYGNGAEYTKILEANGLQEGANIQPVMY